MLKYIKPVIVLALITTVISTLLIATYNLTYKDTSGIITEDMLVQCKRLAGEGDYSVVTDINVQLPESIRKVITNQNGDILFEIVANGYNKGGLDLLIYMNSDGSIGGTSVISISETPGLGTKVNDPEFLDKFCGISEKAIIVKQEPASENEVQAVTSATYSSKGVASAVNDAIEAYKSMEVSK